MSFSAVRIFLLLLLVLSLQACLSVVEEQDEPLRAALDPGVLTSSLKNGFSYYLRSANGAPDNEQIEIRLVVKAGSLHETESQRGYAHLLEHLAYRGTENFTSSDIEFLLGDAGLRWGVDVNATTHYGATVFRFTLHQTDIELLPRIFDLMSEWLVSIKLGPAALEREKRIVEAEWRERYAKRNYVINPVSAVAYRGSRYASNPPIGDLESVRNATVESLTRFYRSHYRADNAALIVTGSSEPWRLEPLIERYFNGIDPAQGLPETTVDAKMPAGTQAGGAMVPQYLSYLDTQRPDAELGINLIAKPLAFSHRADNAIASRFKDQLLFKAFTHLLRNRLAASDLCSSVQVETSLLESGHSIEHIKLSVTESDLLHCLSVASSAIDSVITTELTTEEFSEFNSLYSAIVEDMVARYRNRDATEIADSLAELVVNGEPFMSVWNLQKKLQQVAEALDLAALNSMIGNITDTHQLVYSLVGNTKFPPAPAQLQEAVEKESGTAALRARSRLVNGSLRSDQNRFTVPEVKHKNNTVTKVIERDKYHEWRLQNGATAILIQDDRFDHIALTAISNGGFARQEFASAIAAKELPQFIALNGVGGYVGDSLRSLKSQKQILVEPFVHATSHGINANGGVDDLALLLTLTEGYFQEPMVIEPVSSTFLRRLKNQSSEPQWYQAYWGAGDGDRMDGLTTDLFKTVHRELFKSPAEFAFIFVGSIEPDVLQRELHRVSYARTPVAVKTVRAETSSRNKAVLLNHSPVISDVTFFMTCDMSPGRDQYRQWRLLSDIFTDRLRYSIRERLGLAYEIDSDHFVVNALTLGDYMFHKVHFSVKPEYASDAASLVTKELQSLQRNGVSELELQRAVARDKRIHFTRQRGAIAVANANAKQWLATKDIAPASPGAVSVADLNRLANCISTSESAQVVFNTIDNYNTNLTAKSSNAVRESNGFQGAASNDSGAAVSEKY